MSQKKIAIAIDGLVSSGKGATAVEVAKNLGYTYLDTGATYRAVAWYCVSKNINPTDNKAVIACLPEISMDVYAKEEDTHVSVNGEDITGEIRSMAVNDAVARVASIPEVREKLRKVQREIASQGGYILDGRDIGTHIIPNAELKVFMIGDLEVRAKRRQSQLLEKRGEHVELQDIVDNINQRDSIDYLGPNATSKKADDARDLDTTDLTLEDQIKIVTQRAKEIIHEINNK